MKNLFNSLIKITKLFSKSIATTALTTMTSIIVADKFTKCYRDYQKRKLLLKTNNEKQTQESND